MGVKRKENNTLISHTLSADMILNDIIRTKHMISSTSITKSLFLKFVSTVYIECINRRKETKTSSQIPLHVILYEYFLNKYGLKKTVEKKLRQVIFYKY